MEKAIYINLKKLIACLLILANIFILSSCKKDTSEYVEKSEMALGTVIKLKVLNDNGNADKAITKSFEKIKSIENEMSVKIEDSAITNINNHAYEKKVEISEQMLYVLDKALYYAKLSDGAFDFTIGKLIDAWGIGTDKEHVLSKKEIDKYTGLCSYKDLLLDKENKTISFKNKDVKLDLGAIVKGYVADEVKKIMVDDYDIKSAMLNLGGNVVTVGKKDEENEWTVGIANPKKNDEIFAKLQATNKAVVTSGNYERFFEKDGVRYHHILDPNTSMPADKGIISSTIITNNSIDADALSTATYVMGIEKAKEMIEKIDNTEGLFISNDLKETKTKGIDDMHYNK